MSTGITIFANTVTDNASDTNIVADIVFVGGSHQQLEQTWSGDDSNNAWLRDSLPADLPNIRTIRYSYHASDPSHATRTRIDQWAENLLGDLLACRTNKKDNHRPLIFLCYGLGGDVVKKAMTISCKDGFYRDLEMCTTSIIFVPTSYVTHQEDRITTEGMFVPPSDRQQVVDLEFEMLSKTIQTVDLYDELQTKAMISRRSLQTPITLPEQEGSELGGGNEAMCTFDDPTSEDYRAVLEQLRILVQNASAYLKRKIGRISEETTTAVTVTPQGKKKRTHPDESVGPPDAEAKKQRFNEKTEDPASSQVVRLRFNIPHFAEHAYYPRDHAIRQIQKTLESPHKSFGIHGLGGVGKTQLALSYVSQFGFRYDQVIWIFADKKTKLDFAFEELASRLQLAPTSKPSPPECVQLVRDWLSSNTNYLLVYDNADDLEIIRQFIPSIGGSLLITSRTPTFVRESIVAAGVELRPLKSADGANYLLKKLESSTRDELDEESESDIDIDGEEQAERGLRTMNISKYSSHDPANLKTAKSISEMLGGQPLALSHMASCIRAEGCSLDEFLKDYQRHRDAIDIDFSPEGSSFDYQGSYKDCWNFSFSQLENSPAESLLGLLAFLDPDTIPDRLLRDYAESDLDEIGPLRSNAEYRNAFAALQTHALARRDQKNGTLEVHRLVRNAIIRRLQSTPGKIQRSFEDAIKCLSNVFPRQKQGHSMGDDHDQCRKYAPQLLAVLDTYKYLKGSGPSVNETEPEGSSLFAELLCHCGWYLYETAQSSVALDVLETAREIADSRLSAVGPRLKGLIYSNIGVVLGALNQADKGLTISRLALDIRVKHLPEDDPQVGESLNNCAGCHHDLDQLEKAQKLYQDSVDLQEKSPIRNENLLESAYSNLGRNLMALRRFDEADKAFDTARSYHLTCTSGLFFVSMTIFLIGNLRMYQERWDEAEIEHEKALEMRLDKLGPMNRLTGVSYHQVARLLHRRGIDHGQNPPGAIAMLRKALESFRADPAEPGLAPRTKFLLSSILAQLAGRTANAQLATESRALEDEAAEALRSEPGLTHLPYSNETERAMLVQYEYR